MLQVRVWLLVERHKFVHQDELALLLTLYFLQHGHIVAISFHVGLNLVEESCRDRVDVRQEKFAGEERQLKAAVRAIRELWLRDHVVSHLQHLLCVKEVEQELIFVAQLLQELSVQHHFS